MRLSKEQYEERKAIVRTIMVRNPGQLSSRKLQELLKPMGHSWSLKHCWQMLNIVMAERTQDMDESLTKEVAIFEDTITELCSECWKIIGNKEVREIIKDGEVVGYQPAVTEQDRLRAIEVLAKNMKMLFDLKFDAGIFKKKLGEMQITQFTAFVDLVKASTLANGNKPANDSTAGHRSDSPSISDGAK